MVLFPQAMRDSLEEGHIVFRILDVVDALDITCVTDRMEEKDPRGLQAPQTHRGAGIWPCEGGEAFPSLLTARHHQGPW